MRMTLTRSTAALALAATAFLGACQDVEAEPEPNIVSMQVTVGASAVLIPVNGSQTPGPLRLQVGQNTVVVRFLDATGQVDPVVAEHAADFRLAVTPPSGWTFTTTSSAGGVFTGTLTGATAGTHRISIDLRHEAEGHSEFKKDVDVDVQ